MKKEWSKAEINFVIREFKKGFSRKEIAKKFLEKFEFHRSPDSVKHCIDSHCIHIQKRKPKVLVLDVETKPKKAYIWSPKTEYVNKDMLIEDGSILSWCAKWLGDPSDKVFYEDMRGKEKNLNNDKAMMQKLAKLMSEAELILWQNGDAFDRGEINARFAIHGIPVPDNYDTIDTKKLAKKYLRIPYYSLGYMTEIYNKKYKKQSHKDFPGFSLWEECMRGNKKAWDSMKRYNIFDVLSLEELFINTLSKFARGNSKVAKAIRYLDF